MSTPTIAPIAFRAGETLDDLAFQVTTSNGSPFDLTGCSARLTVRTAPWAATTLADWTSAAGSLVITAATGTITIPLTAAASAALAPGPYVYELAVTFANGTRHVLWAGPFTVIEAVAVYA